MNPTKHEFNALLRNDLTSFIQKAFTTVDPGTPYLHNWHIEAIAWHLQQCFEGEIKRLIITLPPRSLKSIITSVAFLAYSFILRASTIDRRAKTPSLSAP